MSGATWLESTKASVRAWFEKNPDEYLTVGDIAVKFGCTKPYASLVVAELKAARLVALSHGADRRFTRVQWRGGA